MNISNRTTKVLDYSATVIATVLTAAVMLLGVIGCKHAHAREHSGLPFTFSTKDQFGGETWLSQAGQKLWFTNAGHSLNLQRKDEKYSTECNTSHKIKKDLWDVTCSDYDSENIHPNYFKGTAEITPIPGHSDTIYVVVTRNGYDAPSVQDVFLKQPYDDDCTGSLMKRPKECDFLYRQ